MTTYRLSKPDRKIEGVLTLNGSKSISNRALIIQALAGDTRPIDRLSSSKDTVTMQALLAELKDGAVLDTGAAGTTFRFLTAYLSMQPGSQTLTGSERMKKRPIGVLVDALRQLGAQIDYLGEEGYPPLQIGEAQVGGASELHISAGVSSQYISALLMIAPHLPKGLSLHLEGKIVSRPYIEMTLQLMKYFGVQHQWDGQVIRIDPQQYSFRDFTVEADWSAASYFYALAAFSDQVDLRLNGLFEDSLQGDAVLSEMMEQFGVQTRFDDQGIHLSRSSTSLPDAFEWDFIRCPDIAQTLAVVCAGLGIEGVFTGLETLRIKETDRIDALQKELAKVQAGFDKLDREGDKEYFHTRGKAQVNQPVFATYEDHRMAMAFAPLAMWGPISVDEPMVVTKSYPAFWEDLEQLGFQVER